MRACNFALCETKIFILNLSPDVLIDLHIFRKTVTFEEYEQKWKLDQLCVYFYIGTYIHGRR